VRINKNLNFIDMKKIWFTKWFRHDKEYNITLSFEKNNALFDLWLQKDNCIIDENGNLSFYDFRISILKLQLSIFPNIFYGCHS
jgi:hypothetical protein